MIYPQLPYSRAILLSGWKSVNIFFFSKSTFTSSSFSGGFLPADLQNFNFRGAETSVCNPIVMMFQQPLLWQGC